MMVTADGAVKPCCFAPVPLGNLHDSEVDEIWNGPTAIELRQFIKANMIHGICSGAPCKFVQNMQIRIAQADISQASKECETSGDVVANLGIVSLKMRAAITQPMPNAAPHVNDN